MKMYKRQIVRKILLMGFLLLLTATVSACGAKKDAQISELLTLGEKYLAELNYEEAIVTFNKVIELDAKNILAYENLAGAYAVTGDKDSTVEALTRLAELGSENVGLYQQTARVFADSGNYENAIEILQLAIEQFEAGQLSAVMEKYKEGQRMKSFEERLNQIAEMIIQEENYEFNENTILDEEFQNLAQNLTDPVIIQKSDIIYIVIYPGGYVYYGELRDGKREGKGTWYWGDDRRVTILNSEWKNDLPNGAAVKTEIRNLSGIERQPNRVYTKWSKAICTLKDGGMEGAAEITWHMEDGEAHEWSVTYAAGTLQAIDGNIAARCKKCGATLAANGYVEKIEGLD